MYQIRHIKAGDAAAEIMMHMIVDGGWWWIHADEDEGFRMARLNTPSGDRLAKSCSPSLTGPYDASVGVESLALALRKAQNLERTDAFGMPRRTAGAPESYEMANVRSRVLELMDGASLTTHDVSVQCGVNGKVAPAAIAVLLKRGAIVRSDEVHPSRFRRGYYWRKVA